MITKKEAKILREFTEFASRQNDEAFTYDKLLGFIYGLAITPDIIVPSEWFEEIYGGKELEFPSQKQAEDFISTLIQVYNHTLAAFQNDKLEFPFDFSTAPLPVDKIAEWTWGFDYALQMRPECWLGRDTITDVSDADKAFEEFDRSAIEEDKERMACLVVVSTIANPENAEQIFKSRPADDPVQEEESWAKLYAMLPSAVEYLQNYAAEQEHLRQQELRARNRSPTPQPAARKKIGRNEPCPCGSGKKYKKCCLLKEKVVPIR